MTEPRETGPIWRCPVCYFGFHAEHVNEKDGGYSCPSCAELQMRKTLGRVKSFVDELVKDYRYGEACP